jgi:hypothetical protein
MTEREDTGCEDVELTRALERGEVPDEGFHHASHLRVAWVYLAESPSVDVAGARMASTLRRFASSVGTPAKYHETITLFWIRVLAAARAAIAGASLDDVLRADPRLLDKDHVLAYYSAERLFGDAARQSWVDPDRQPLTSEAASSMLAPPRKSPASSAMPAVSP